MRYLENYIYALKETLSENMGEALREIEADAADDITLEDFKELKIGYINIFGKPAPSCYIYPAGATYEESAMDAEIVTFSAELWFSVKHSVPDSLTKKIMRYSDAIRKVIYENNTLGDSVLMANTAETEFYPGPESMLAVGRIKIVMLGELRN